MPFLAMLIGALLVGLGLQGHYDFGNILGVDKYQPTALIPAYVGAALFVLGLIALVGDATRKHAMHLAAAVGLLGFAGALYKPVRGMIDHTFDFDRIPTKLQLAMAGLCLAFVLMCVQSFINARRLRSFGGG